MDGDALSDTSRPDDSANLKPQKTLSETLDDLCAYYMLCGVPCDEFWDGDYTRFKFYVEAHKMAVEERNREMWLQGLYNLDAFSVALSKALDKHSTAKYLEEPIRVTPMNDIEKKQEAKKIEEKFRAQLMALTRRAEEKHRREDMKNAR